MNNLPILGRTTCGRALVWSLAANAVLFTLLMLSVIRYPVPGEGESKQRAAELEQARQQVMQGVQP